MEMRRFASYGAPVHPVTAWVNECRCGPHLSCEGRRSECLCPPLSPARCLDASPAALLGSLYCRSRRCRSPSLSSLLRAPSFSPSVRLGLSDLVRSVRSAAAGGTEWMDGTNQLPIGKVNRFNHVTTVSNQKWMKLPLNNFKVKVFLLLFLLANSLVSKAPFTDCFLVSAKTIHMKFITYWCWMQSF